MTISLRSKTKCSSLIGVYLWESLRVKTFENLKRSGLAIYQKRVLHNIVCVKALLRGIDTSTAWETGSSTVNMINLYQIYLQGDASIVERLLIAVRLEMIDFSVSFANANFKNFNSRCLLKASERLSCELKREKESWLSHEWILLTFSMLRLIACANIAHFIG